MQNITYFNFLKNSSAIRKKLDVALWQMFEEIGLSLCKDPNLVVGDILEWGWQASPATLHSRLKKLIRKGYVVLEEDADDKRIRYVALTTAGLQLFKDLQAVMDRAR